MSGLLKVSSNPHIRSKVTTSSIMTAVVIALLPAAGFGIYNFGPRALAVMAVTIASTVLTELLFGWLWKKKITISDMSAVVTGLLLALNLPVSIPLWMAALGGVFAILVVKMLFGGLGQNFMNPALAARCFLLISFPSQMTNFACDAYTGATPLAALKAGESVNVMNMIVGKTAGTIGETSVIALLIGACFLILIGVIDLRIPGTYIVTVILFAGIFGGHGFDPAYLSAQLAGGGLILGAFFMATDYVTRPITIKGQYVYGAVLGLLTGIFRIFGPGAEGVSYAIILGNLLVPLIEKFTMPVAFGRKAGAKRAITLIAGLLLGFVYELTKEPIRQQEEKAVQEACQAVFADAEHFEELDAYTPSADTAQKLADTGITIGTVYEAQDASGTQLGYVIQTTTSEGYGGNIVLYVGIRLDGTVNDISILSISETPGLGMKAGDVLVPQFHNKNVKSFAYTKTGSTSDSEIDAISGATITTKAVTNAVNGSLLAFNDYVQGGAGNE